VNHEQAAAALLQLVAENREAKCRALHERAAAEARAILEPAHAQARKRVRTALEEARRRGEERLARAQARHRGRERLAAQRRLKASLELAWRELEGLLARAWQDRAERRRWVEAYAERAVAVLAREDWQVVHPVAWQEAERDELRQFLVTRGVARIDFTPDSGISAGVKFRSGNSVLDATTGGLLGDRTGVEGRLLFHAEGSAS